MKIKLKENTLQILCVILGMLDVSGLIIYYLLLKMSNYINIGYLSFINKFTFETVVAYTLLNITFLILLFKKIRKLQVKRIKLKRFLLSAFQIAIGSYLILCIFFYSIQDELIGKNNLIFQPDSHFDSNLQDNVEEINFKTSDNIKLQGWLVKNCTNDKSPLIIYFGGSGQEVSGMVHYAKKLEGYSVAFFNYRGFGLSEGTPNQDSCFNDAKLIYDTLSKREDIDSKRIVTMGWSLGTSISVYLSDNRPIKGTILVSPIENMYSRFKVPFIPLSILMKQSFNSISRAPNINCPLLCLIGDNDINVLPKSSIKLVKKWKGKSTVKTYEGDDHFLLFKDSNSWLDIQDFLKSLK
jgi:dienelactone hydrolase